MLPFFLPPVLALLGGAAGFALRLRELATAFEADTGLPIPGAGTSTALAFLCVAVMALLGGVLWRMCRNAPTLDYGDAFRCSHPAVWAANVASALLLAGGGLACLLDYVRGINTNLLSCVLAALLVGSAGCLLLTGRNNYRGAAQQRYNGYLLLPAYTYCLWLVLTYQAQAGNPVIQQYVYQILAIICSLLGFYFTASFSFEKGKAFLALWTGLLAAFFSGIALADFSSRMNIMLTSFSIVYFTAHSAVLLRNLTAKREE